MAALTGKKPKNTYKDLLQVSNSNAGIDGTLRFVSDGEGTDSTLKLSTSSISTTSKVVVGGDTAAGDDAAMGYTSAEGLILTGQGSTNDVTIKNDADQDVLEIPTGTQNVTMAGNLSVAGDLTITGDDLVMSTNTSGAALIADGTNFNPVVISGDAAIATNGALTIANDAITSAKIADDAITSALIADDAVGSAAIADDAITAALIADDAVGSAAIADDAITSALIADDAVVTASIADDAITSALIADDAVVTAAIADDAITSALIADDAVVSAAIADNAVVTAAINDDAVTLAKMAGLARGKLIYGDSSGNPAALAVGSANYVLTSDGTDFAWAAASSGAVTSYTNSTDNRVITSVNSTTINGEANLTFDGSVLAVTGNVTASGTVEPAGDTSAGDNAAIGYTSAEGLILTGQGSTNDITIKNDADADVFTVPTGTTAPIISGQQMPSAGGLWTGRNLIINGEMKVSQRGTSFSALANNAYSTDRWLYYEIGDSVITASQATDTPTNNFKNSLKADVTTADASVAAGDLSCFLQKIEGLNCSALGWGTAQAKSVTLSFWVKSPKTGTHSIALKNSAQDRSYVAEYTIDSADTWEHQSITVAGDTSGTWLTTTGIGLQVVICLMAGTDFTKSAGSWGAGNDYGSDNQVNCVDNTSNDFYFTGVQLEIGSAATPFEHELSYTETLQKCQRYYQTINPKVNSIYASGYQNNSERISQVHRLGVEMRAEPTCTVHGTWAVSNCSQPAFTSFSTNTVSTHVLQNSGSAASAYYHANDTGDFFSMDAEL